MKDKDTSERLRAWIYDLGLYREFEWKFRLSRESSSEAEYETLAIEFLKSHFANLYKETPEHKAHLKACGEALELKQNPAPGEYRSAPALREIDKKERAESMAMFKEFAARLREKAQTYAQDAEERQEERARRLIRDETADLPSYEVREEIIKDLTKPTDPWGAPTDTRGYPEK